MCTQMLVVTVSRWWDDFITFSNSYLYLFLQCRCSNYIYFIYIYIYLYIYIYTHTRTFICILVVRSSLWDLFFLYFYLIYLFIYGCVGSLSFRVRAFSSCGKWGPLFIAERGPLFIAVRGPFTIAAPPAAGHRLQTRRLSSCGSRAQSLRGMWDPPRPGLEPVSPALAGRLSTTTPPGKPACGILVPQPGIEPAPLAVKSQSPKHWTARKFPN